jgi:hypothetical protein
MLLTPVVDADDYQGAKLLAGGDALQVESGKRRIHTYLHASFTDCGLKKHI